MQRFVYNVGTPIAGWFVRENPIECAWFGVHHYFRNSICYNTASVCGEELPIQSDGWDGTTLHSNHLFHVWLWVKSFFPPVTPKWLANGCSSPQIWRYRLDPSPSFPGDAPANICKLSWEFRKPQYICRSSAVNHCYPYFLGMPQDTPDTKTKRSVVSISWDMLGQYNLP